MYIFVLTIDTSKINIETNVSIDSIPSNASRGKKETHSRFGKEEFRGGRKHRWKNRGKRFVIVEAWKRYSIVVVAAAAAAAARRSNKEFRSEIVSRAALENERPAIAPSCFT